LKQHRADTMAVKRRFDAGMFKIKHIIAVHTPFITFILRAIDPKRQSPQKRNEP